MVDGQAGAGYDEITKGCAIFSPDGKHHAFSLSGTEGGTPSPILSYLYSTPAFSRPTTTTIFHPKAQATRFP